MILLFELAFVFILGSCLGSFFNVCIYRIPLKESIVFPASHCPECKKPIPFWLNIPYLGYILTLGKCRNCGSKIHWHYMLVEISTAVLFSLLYLRFYGNFSFIFFKYAVLSGFFVIIFFIDLFHSIIPDKLSLPLIPLGLLASLHPASDISLTYSLLGGFIGFIFFYAIAFFYWKLTKREGMGGGDIKLIAGIGTFVGLTGVFFSILSSAVIALLVILISRHNLKKEFPFGPFLVIGTLFYIFFGNRIITWYLDLFLNSLHMY